jgi:hypothetical protein
MHTALLLIIKYVLNYIHWAVVRRLYQVVISKYHMVFRYAFKCNLFLLPSEHTAFLGQFSRQTQILKGIIYRLNFTLNRKINLEISDRVWFTSLKKACADFHETLSLNTLLGHLYCILSRVDEKCRKFCNIPFAPGIKEWRSLRRLSWEVLNFWTLLVGDFLYRISPKSVSKYGKSREKLSDSLK